MWEIYLGIVIISMIYGFLKLANTLQLSESGLEGYDTLHNLSIIMLKFLLSLLAIATVYLALMLTPLVIDASECEWHINETKDYYVYGNNYSAYHWDYINPPPTAFKDTELFHTVSKDNYVYQCVNETVYTLGNVSSMNNINALVGIYEWSTFSTFLTFLAVGGMLLFMFFFTSYIDVFQKLFFGKGRNGKDD